ncbi:MAG: hypothetical protein V1750_05325 [Acidobacteriota bacterium]
MSRPPSFWQGKGVLVAGASSGIGETMSHQFATGGPRPALTGRDGERLERVTADCRARFLSVVSPALLEAILARATQ